jgi:uncharacterized protein (TIGR03067 family)
MKPFPLVAASLVLAGSLGLSIAAPAPKDDKDDLKKFEGDWVFTSWEFGGQTLPAEFRDSAKWSVKGDKYTFEMNEQKEEGTIKLDPAKKPATIDFAITAGNDKGKDQPGIYKVDGDTITICLARPGGKERPTDFKSTEENGFILVTVKKSK